MPISILASLLVCTLLYVLVALALTGVVSYKLLGVSDPIAVGIDRIVRAAPLVAPAQRAFTFMVKLGALAGLTSVILVLMLGQTRIFFSMAKDGLLPWFGNLHRRHRTPHCATVLTGRVRGRRRRAHAHQPGGQAGLHRHPPGLPPGMPGRADPAPHQPRGGPAVQGAAALGGGPGRRRRLPLGDVRPGPGHLDPPGAVACRRPGASTSPTAAGTAALQQESGVPIRPGAGGPVRACPWMLVGPGRTRSRPVRIVRTARRR